jgi:hypothetical protein
MSGKLMMQEKEVIDALCNSFDFIIEENKYDFESFGNEMIVLKADNIRIRFISDRGDINIEINKSDFKNWFSIECVLELLGVYKNPNSNKNIELKRLNELFIKNISEIKDVFLKEDTKLLAASLNEIEKRKVKEMFDDKLYRKNECQ